MKYFLLREQAGQGCDYTIGCGITFEPLRANTMDEAITEVMGISDDWKTEILQGSKNTGYSVDDYIHDYILCGGSGLSDVEGNTERRMVTIRIYEVSNEVDMRPALTKRYDEIKAWQQELKCKEQEKAEYRQYEKLKKKFEK